MYRSVVLGLGVAALCLLLNSATVAQTSTACQATSSRPIAICFDDVPLTVGHCDKPVSLTPHFKVKRFHSADSQPPSYYFKYQLLVNGVPDGDPQDPLHSKYDLTEDDPNVPITMPFDGDASYSIRVTVYADGLAPFTDKSPAIRLEDKPQVRAFVVGISHYDNSAHASLDDLLHADSDAKAFASALTQLLPPDAHVEVRTSEDTADKLSRADILGYLSNEAETQNLCGDNDWFIFYFSGHGIVGATRQSNGNQIFGHYLSTKQFDPKNLTRTSIRVTDLLTSLYDINATNELVVLDSCFSGAFRKASVSQPSNGPRAGCSSALVAKSVGNHSSKRKYVLDGQLRDPVEIGSADEEKQGGDTSAFQNTASQLEPRRRGLYLSAAGADHEAEEGFESYGQAGLDFIPSDCESDSQKKHGHGLYTFALLWNLLSQVPVGTSVGADILGGTPPAAPAAVCRISFSEANTDATSDIGKFAKRHSIDVQTPNVSGRTHEDLPALICEKPTSSGSANGQSN
jgi:hypothetical protein